MTPVPLLHARVVHQSALRYAPIKLTADQRKAFKALLDEVLASYGVDPNGPRMPIMRALRDFIARTAIHGHPPLHPAGSAANLFVHPAGKVWADFLAVFTSARMTADDAYWASFGLDGIAKFQKLFGTVQAGGTLADDGMLTRIGSGQWRIRETDYSGYKTMLCTHQDTVFAVAAVVYGCWATIVSTVGHDGCAVYIPGGWGDNQQGWMWCDITYNECVRLDGAGPFLSPLELHYYSLQGWQNRLISDHMAGPAHDPEPYIPHSRATDSTYFNDTGNHPNGMNVSGTLLSIGVHVGTTSMAGRVLTQLPAAALATTPPFNNATSYPRYPAHIVYPDLGLAITGWDELPSGAQFTLAASTAGAAPYTLEKRVTPPGGSAGAWTPHATWGDTVSDGAGLTEYRLKDANGLYCGLVQVKS